MSLRLQTVLLALLVLVSVGGAVQLPATPQYIPHKTCPLQGCEAPLPVRRIVFNSFPPFLFFLVYPLAKELSYTPSILCLHFIGAITVLL